MEVEEIWEMVRRARLHLVRGNRVGKDKVYNNRKRKSAILFDQSISYQTLSSSMKSRTNAKQLTSAPLSRHKTSGTKSALPTPPMAARNNSRADDNEVINPISNSPVIDAPADNEVPNRYEFEIMRQRRRILELECTVRDRDDRIVKALGMIEDELAFWRTLLHDHVGEPLGATTRRVGRLESALDYLKEKGSRFYPPLEIPEGWKRKQS